MTPTGWFLVAFAIGVRCDPTPCPSVPVMLGFLAIALVGTASLGCYVVRRLGDGDADGS